MNKNAIALTIAVIVGLAGIGYLATRQSQITPPVTTPTATSTPPIATPPPARQPNAPLVETNNDATVSNSTVVVTGRVNPNGAQTSYWFEYGQTTSLGTRTAAQTLGSGYVNIPTPGYITGLTPSTLYYFRLSARNNFGTVNGTMYSFTTSATVPPPPQGNAPTTQTQTANDVSRTTANLNGRVNPNGAQTSYWFEYGTSQDLGNTTAFQSAGSGTTYATAAISITDLQPSTKYFFRLNAQNQYGTINGAILNFTTQGPPAPTAPSADTKAPTGITTSTAVLRGTLNPNGAVTTYWFEYSTDNLIGNIIGTATQEQTDGSGYANVDISTQISGLAENTKYFARLVARNSFGTVRGDVVTFRTASR